MYLTLNTLFMVGRSCLYFSPHVFSVTCFSSNWMLVYCVFCLFESLDHLCSFLLLPRTCTLLVCSLFNFLFASPSVRRLLTWFVLPYSVALYSVSCQQSSLLRPASLVSCVWVLFRGVTLKRLQLILQSAGIKSETLRPLSLSSNHSSLFVCDR